MSPSTPGDAARSVPVRSQHEPEPVPVPKPELDELQGHGQEQAFLPGSAPSCMSVPQLPDDGVVPLVAENEAKTSGVLSSPTTPVPSFEKKVAPDQNDKSSWSSAFVTAVAVPVRPKGPSLLTQQLAEARGILVATGQSLDTSHSGLRPQHSSCDPAIGSVPKQSSRAQESDKKIQTTNDEPERRDDSDDSSLTPRASPRAVPMATTTAAVSTFSLPHRVTNTILPRTGGSSDIADEEQRLRGHVDLIGSNGRTFSSERTDRNRKPKDLPPIHRTYSDTLASPHDVVTMTPEQDDDQAQKGLDHASTAEERSPARPRKPDHRLSMGPEKVWSIGSDDLNNDQDGLVEKSIAEVLAGVEPNTRSRKASHSLRFFKEGLPEEKIRRRDSRLATSREKLLAADDAMLDRHIGSLHGGDQIRGLQPSPGQTEGIPGRFMRTRTFPLQSTDTHHHDTEASDYFQAHIRDKGHAAPQTPLERETVPTEKDQPTDYPTIEEDEEPQEGGSDVAVEDADLSSEEKISSAVFVPHKAPQDVPKRPVESEVVFDAPGKTHQRNDDGASWLVKADEPEADEPGTSEAIAEHTAHDTSHHQVRAGHHDLGVETSTQPAPLPTATIENEVAPQDMAKPPQVFSPGYEEHVHNHQLAPEKPLDAIELIPYRHQVGGHTTLWRFSKRAVCKQLNNRENEFYEKIERYHRDLLPFLPRYVQRRVYVKQPWLVITDTDVNVGTLVFSMSLFLSNLAGSRL